MSGRTASTAVDLALRLRACPGANHSGATLNWALQLWQRSASLALIASQALHSLRFREDEHDEHDSSPTSLSCPHARHLSVAMVHPATESGACFRTHS